MCTLRRCKSTPTRKAKLLWTTSRYGPSVVRSVTETPFTFSLDSALRNGGRWIFHRNYILWQPPAFWHRHNFWSAGINCRSACAQRLNFVAVPFPRYQGMTLCPDPWPFEPEINGLRQTVEYYYCAKFQAIRIESFRLILLTYTPAETHIVTSWSQYPRRRTTSSVWITTIETTLQEWTVEPRVIKWSDLPTRVNFYNG